MTLYRPSSFTSMSTDTVEIIMYYVDLYLILIIILNLDVPVFWSIGHAASLSARISYGCLDQLWSTTGQESQVLHLASGQLDLSCVQ